MNPFDLLALIFENLSRRKARVALTAVGVVIGTASVVILVSLGVGLQMNANEQLGGIGDLTLIQVMPGFNSEGGGGVIIDKGFGGGGGGGSDGMTLITDSAVKNLRGLPSVAAVVPYDYMQANGTMRLGRLEGYMNAQGVGTTDVSELGFKAAQGSTTLVKGTLIVGALVNQNFYDPKLRPGDEVPPPPDLYDQIIRLVLIKYSEDGVEIRKSMLLRVAGVLAETRDWNGTDYTAFLSMEDLNAINGWALGRRINRERDGYSMAMVKATDVNEVLDLADQITALGFQASTPQSFVQGINSFYVVLQVVFGGVGAIALLVAAIGIANTMTMAILERTREIGLMKAVGATNRDVLSVFLGEAAGIGFIGGLGGITFGWSLGQVINVVVVAYLAGQAASTGGLPPTIAVFTPSWLLPFALFFATLIGLVSGLYPALRAATLVPVSALKYE